MLKLEMMEIETVKYRQELNQLTLQVTVQGR